MPVWRGKRYDIPEPLFHDAVIAAQKRAVRRDSTDALAWLELGRLYESRLEWVNRLAEKDPLVRYALPLYLLFVGLPMVLLMPRMLGHLPLFWQRCVLLSSAVAAVIASAAWIWSLRYPPSGEKYLKKAIALHPCCGEAHMYLGLIAFRRLQDVKASDYLEKAFRLGIRDSQITNANCRGVIRCLLVDRQRFLWTAF